MSENYISKAYEKAKEANAQVAPNKTDISKETTDALLQSAREGAEKGDDIIEASGIAIEELKNIEDLELHEWNFESGNTENENPVPEEKESDILTIVAGVDETGFRKSFKPDQTYFEAALGIDNAFELDLLDDETASWYAANSLEIKAMIEMFNNLNGVIYHDDEECQKEWNKFLSNVENKSILYGPNGTFNLLLAYKRAESAYEPLLKLRYMEESAKKDMHDESLSYENSDIDEIVKANLDIGGGRISLKRGTQEDARVERFVRATTGKERVKEEEAKLWEDFSSLITEGTDKLFGNMKDILREMKLTPNYKFDFTGLTEYGKELVISLESFLRKYESLIPKPSYFGKLEGFVSKVKDFVNSLTASDFDIANIGNILSKFKDGINGTVNDLKDSLGDAQAGLKDYLDKLSGDLGGLLDLVTDIKVVSALAGETSGKAGKEVVDKAVEKMHRKEIFEKLNPLLSDLKNSVNDNDANMINFSSKRMLDSLYLMGDFNLKNQILETVNRIMTSSENSNVNIRFYQINVSTLEKIINSMNN